MRRAAGAAALLMAAGLLTWLSLTEASRWWRLSSFPLLWFGALGLLQAQARTCVALAARRTCDGDVEGRPLTDADAETLAHRGGMILRRATLLAAAVTALAVLLTFPF